MSDYIPPPSPPVPLWKPVLFGVGFVLLFVGWIFFEEWWLRLFTEFTSGSWVESALNWLSRAYLWLALAVFAAAIIWGSITKR